MAALVPIDSGDLAALEQRIEFLLLPTPSTISKIKEWLRSHVAKVRAIGVASFGPIDPEGGLSYLWLHYQHAQTWLDEYRCDRPSGFTGRIQAHSLQV